MNRNKIILRINTILEDLRKNEIIKDSFDWYLNNHLNILLDKLEQNANSKELSLSAKKFIMFCTDSMDWDNPKYKDYVELGKMIETVAKKETGSSG